MATSTSSKVARIGSKTADIGSQTADIGFIVDAGPGVGYGHVVRCLRIAEDLMPDRAVSFYPLSEPCAQFLSERGSELRFDRQFPPLVVSDLCRAHSITDTIRTKGCRHISIRDLGLAQCDSDVVIDGSITQIVPYAAHSDRKMFVGPDFTVVDPRSVQRGSAGCEILVSLGGGVCPEYMNALLEALADRGFRVCATQGFDRTASLSTNPAVRWISGPDEIRGAVFSCLLAIANAGLSLYEMLAAGVPTIALSVDELQLKTAAAFAERGAVESAGVMSLLHPEEVVERAIELRKTPSLMRQLTEAGRRLVDGRGLLRVRKIVRRELCPSM